MELSWLSDPTIFAAGTLPPVSDHELFASSEELAKGQSSLVRSLDGTWLAHFAMNPAGADESVIADASGDAALLPVTVPGEFQLQYPDWDPPHYVNVQYPWDGHEALKPPQVSAEYNPTVTCVKTFSLTAEELDCGRAVLTFEGVEAAVAVWLNGAFVGYAEDSFTPHRFDATPFLRAGENRLAARVFRRCSGSWLEDQDFWRFSGFHRSVTLTLEPKSHLADLFVHTPLTENYTHAALDVEMKLDRPNGSLRLSLSDAEGRALLSETLPQAEEVRCVRGVSGVSLWSAEDPQLYTLTVALLDPDGREVEVSRCMVGFRQFELIDRVMCLNGQRIVFHGVNRHEFDCERGRVMTEELLLRDLRDMKGMNVNAIRTCHYPNTTLFYRLCDRYGFYVIDETNIETHGTWAFRGEYFDPIPGDRPEWREAVLARGRAMQERDKNHPCVLLWSCGNESFGGRDLFDLSEQFRRRDPSRLVHYEGCSMDPRCPDTTDVYSRMYLKVEDIERYLQGRPAKPFINCEFTHAMGNSCGGISLYTALEDKYPMYQGGFIWDYVDQALRVKGPNGQTRLAYGGDFGDRPADWHFNTNGIILGDRTHTPKVQEVRHCYADVRLTPDAHGVTVTNRRRFAPLKGVELRWEVTFNREPFAEGTEAVPEIAPMSHAYVRLDWGDVFRSGGDIVLTCFLCLTEDAGLLPRGTVIAQGQTVHGDGGPTVFFPDGVPVVKGPTNIGARWDGWGVLMSRGEGLVSLRDGLGRECLLHAPQLSLFRAPTDNDRGNRDALRQGIWHAVSRYSLMENAVVSEEDLRGRRDPFSRPEITARPGDTLPDAPVFEPDSGPISMAAPELPLAEASESRLYPWAPFHPDGVDCPITTVTWRYENRLLPQMDLRLSMSPQSDGLHVALKWRRVAGQPDLPCFGLSFPLDHRLTHVAYWGMGPEECYPDRCTGARLGRFRYDVQDGWTRYAKPQESGSRMGVKELTVTRDDGHGLALSSYLPLQVSVQPWLPEELAAVWHPDELMGSCRTVLDVSLFRKGVGGDDSWGAPVLPQYTYSSDQDYTLEFVLKGI